MLRLNPPPSLEFAIFFVCYLLSALPQPFLDTLAICSSSFSATRSLFLLLFRLLLIGSSHLLLPTPCLLLPPHPCCCLLNFLVAARLLLLLAPSPLLSLDPSAADRSISPGARSFSAPAAPFRLLLALCCYLLHLLSCLLSHSLSCSLSCSLGCSLNCSLSCSLG